MKKALIIVLMIIPTLLVLSACNNNSNNNPDNQNQNIEVEQMIKLTSPAFANNGRIPDKYTCKGQSINPELNIAGIPSNAKSLVLIMDDPDAPSGNWDHWIVFNMPVSTTTIEENSEPEGVGGRNSWGRTGYGAPCPPSGTHRYTFKIYALDAMLSLKQEASKAEIEKAMKGHVVEEAKLVGLYGK